MADTRSITITLKLVESESSANTSQQTNTGTGNFAEDENASRTKAAAKALAIQALTASANEALAWAEYYWNRELTLTDDYIGQRNKQIALTQINRTIGYSSQFFSSVASGAAVGGVWGALIGGAIGAVTIAANIARSNVQGKMDQDVKIAQMDAQLGFTRARAGWSINAASIGEDL